MAIAFLYQKKKRKKKSPLLFSSNLHWNEFWPNALQCAAILHCKHIRISINVRLSLLSRKTVLPAYNTSRPLFALPYHLFQNAETKSAHYFINLLFNSCHFAFSTRLTEQDKSQVKDCSHIINCSTWCHYHSQPSFLKWFTHTLYNGGAS